MSTAVGLVLLMNARHKQLELAAVRFAAYSVAGMQRRLYAYLWWRVQMQLAADATRYQLTYTPKP